MTFVANCRDIYCPSPSRRPLVVFADLTTYCCGGKIIAELRGLDLKSVTVGEIQLHWGQNLYL